MAKDGQDEPGQRQGPEREPYPHTADSVGSPVTDSSDTDALEEWKLQELADAYRPTPLRTIVAITRDGKRAQLSCGYLRMLVIRIRVGDTVRCWSCFDEGMSQAEQMVGGSGSRDEEDD